MEFDGFVDTFVNEYGLFTEALKGAFLSAVVSGDITPAKLKELELRAYKAAKTYYTRASRELESYTQELMLDDGSEQLEASLLQRKRDVLFGVRTTVLGSVKTVLDAARGKALGGSLRYDITKVPDYVKGPDGRTWAAEKLTRAMVRDFAYQSQTDKAIDEILLSGASKVAITYDVPGEREYENAVISTSELIELRPKIFHINASARVTANV